MMLRFGLVPLIALLSLGGCQRQQVSGEPCVVVEMPDETVPSDLASEPLSDFSDDAAAATGEHPDETRCTGESIDPTEDTAQPPAANAGINNWPRTA